MGQTLPPIPKQVALQAVEWQLAIQAGEASQEDMRQWLAADESHRQAWEHIQATNGRLQALMEPAARHAVLSESGKARRQLSKWFFAALFVGGGAVAYRERPWEEHLADIRSIAGERKSLRLANGRLLVEINSDTALNLRLQGHNIELDLLQGEILLTTFSGEDKTLRLSVVTKDGVLQPLGTRFMVSHRTQRTQVSVYEGKVRAFTANQDFKAEPDSYAQQVINAGEKARLVDGHLSERQAADEQQSAWSRGMLVANRMPLDEFLETLSYHRPGYLQWDSELSQHLISGTYPLEDTDRILTSLEQTLPITVKRRTRYWVRIEGRSR